MSCTCGFNDQMGHALSCPRFSGKPTVTRLLLINDEHPGGVVARCDQCKHWTRLYRANDGVYLGRCDTLDEGFAEYFGCALFTSKETT